MAFSKSRARVVRVVELYLMLLSFIVNLKYS